MKPYKYHDIIWMKRYNEVKRFFEETGRFPATTSTDIEERKLGIWCQNMRGAKAGVGNCDLTKEKEDLLNAINFNWKRNIKTPWMRRYNALKDFIHENGRWPSQCSPNKEEVTLYFWCVRQRQSRYDHKKGAMSEERIYHLDKIGFSWVKHSECIIIKNYKDEK